MIYRTLVRALITSAALAAGALLAGCNSDEISLANNAKANKPVPPKLVADMAAKDMDLQSPMLVRLFKQEAELEVWKQDRSGRFALLKTYPICRWSGDLGPKVREGDRQAPEGFYAITPAQMNPQSAYYLSFNTGYPNAFDRALGRTGSQLMVHGDCSSRGCYAMTDEQIAEIYSLGRESFFGGQRAFQFQAYPFRMTPVNMAKHRNNPNMPFWKMIKEGYDHFEVTKQEPKVDFCEKKYVFDAVQAAERQARSGVRASAKCPAYVIPDEIADAVREKQQAGRCRDRQAGRQGNAGRPDQYRHRRRHEQGVRLANARRRYRTVGRRRRPGLVGCALRARRAPFPPTVNPPTSADVAGRSVAGAPARRPAGRDAASAAPDPARNPTASSATSPARSALAARPIPPRARSLPPPAKPEKIEGRSRRVPKPRFQNAAAPKPSETRAGRCPPALKPSVTDTAGPAAAGACRRRQRCVAGAQPIVPANSFDSRFWGDAVGCIANSQAQQRAKYANWRVRDPRNFQDVLLLRVGLKRG